jgi:hypothetical protein
MHDTCVGADSDVNHCIEKLRWCSLNRRGWSAARGRTVRDLVQDSCSLPDESDGPHLKAGQSARAQRRQSSPAPPKSRYRERPHWGREILGFV